MEDCLLAPPLSDEAYARCFREFRRDCKEWRAMTSRNQNRIVELGKTRILAASAGLTMAGVTRCPTYIYRHPLP
ncbi:MAG: hypothetical protein D4R73_03360 [Deltaproteobacteria bacterium]|nr:MAG: hypothetical protein D4R73_03360 [Deltaproteobacteria bacterium]